MRGSTYALLRVVRTRPARVKYNHRTTWRAIFGRRVRFGRLPVRGQAEDKRALALFAGRSRFAERRKFKACDDRSNLADRNK